MKINSVQIKALQSALEKSPKAKLALKSWAEAKALNLKEQTGSSAPKANTDSLGSDILDALTESEMAHVSRPDGLQSLHAKGITGKGVTVAVVDSGMANHPDFEDRVVAFRDFTGKRTVKRNPLDVRGHGTHVAGIIAGASSQVPGMAPDSKLVGCRIGSEKDAIKAIDWVIENKEKYSIDILNLSLGVDAPENAAEDEFRKAAERAVKAGLIVVAAAGNECATSTCNSTISSPGNSPEVITVGALDDMGTATRKDDRVYRASSRGQENGGKPDLVAEGVNVLAPLAPASNYARKLAATANYVALVGSSQAAPMVSGAIALMLQVNPDLDHQDVKSILKATADSLEGAPLSAQGNGRLDLLGAVDAAKRRLKSGKG